MSTFTEPAMVAPGYDTSTDFPTEPAGWGPPGHIRHAEAIGHGVWIAGHPEKSGSEEDESHLDYDPIGGAHLDALLDDAFGQPQCGVRGCVLPPHDAHWRAHEDAQGRAWYPGEAPR